MKLRIKESRFDRYPDFLKELKSYIRKIASLNPDIITYEDLMSFDWSGIKMIEDEIKRCENKGLSVEDCIDTIIENLRYWINWVKDEMQHRSDYQRKIDKVYSILDVFLQDNYNVLNKTDSSDGYSWTIIPPKNSNHDDCIAFVDSIADAVDGSYYTTGRGSSWSKWWLICDDGVLIEAGWSNRKDYWVVNLNAYR